MKELFGLKGKMEIKKFESNILVNEYTYENLITDLGLITLFKMIGGDVTGGINRIGLGTGNIASAFSDIALNNKIILVNVTKDYSETGKIIFYANIPENSFQNIVSYQEGGLIYKNPTTNEEILITRLVFDDTIYQNPNNSLSLSYSLELIRS